MHADVHACMHACRRRLDCFCHNHPIDATTTTPLPLPPNPNPNQYLSALLMAAPLAKGDVTIEITDELVSAPYVHMTIKLMARFGVQVQNEGDMRFTIKVSHIHCV
jgi:hypothetical protein